MIYPAYQVTGEDGETRSFFWFCFARLKELDERARKYADFLGSEYTLDGRRPYWDFTGDGNGPSKASDVVHLDVALHTPEWSEQETALVMEHPLFSDFTWSRDGEFVVFGTDTKGKLIDEIMYPVFMLRDIFSAKDAIDMLQPLGLPLMEAAILGSQFYVVKDFRGKTALRWICDDYRLAMTFEGLAKLVDTPIPYDGNKWGYIAGGYNGNEHYCSIPESRFDLPGKQQDIEDIDDAFGEDEGTGMLDTAKIIVDCYTQAKENLRDKT